LELKNCRTPIRESILRSRCLAGEVPIPHALPFADAAGDSPERQFFWSQCLSQSFGLVKASAAHGDFLSLAKADDATQPKVRFA